MTMIRTTCPDCGVVKMPANEVTLRVCRDDDSGVCVVRCPVCRTRFTKDTDDRLIMILCAAGVAIDYWTLPAELSERPYFDTPLTEDHLIDFHDVLHGDDDLFGLITGR